MIRTLQSLRFFFIMLVVLSHYIGSSFDFGGHTCTSAKDIRQYIGSSRYFRLYINSFYTV